MKLNRWMRMRKLELPFATTGLVWNSLMSWAGGWFFLMACEMFIVKGKDFRLPGIGSFIQLSANNGDITRVLIGLLVMILIIVLLDLIIWKPLVAWAQKFRMDNVLAEDEKESIILDIFRSSKIMERLIEKVDNFADRLNLLLTRRKKIDERKKKGIFYYGFLFIFFSLIIYLFFNGVLFFVRFFYQITTDDLLFMLKAGLLSFLRTTSAIIIASLWTIPLGVVIGMKPKVARVLQPIIQIAASVPATALFPIIIYFLIKIGGGLGFGSIFLMLLGTQWYILFNVIAGASAIPQDLKDTAKLYNINGWRKWKVLILPAIFPYLVTGLITATGGAWNASIVSEYVVFGGEVQKTIGLGSLISEASAVGNYPILLASTILMSIIVVSLNRLVWKRLFTLAEEKFRLDQ